MCRPIQRSIQNKKSQIQVLEGLKADTSNRAKIDQIDRQIRGIEQGIASLQRLARFLRCPE